MASVYQYDNAERFTKRIGETVDIFIEYDDSDRKISMHPDLEKAINENPVALKNFEKLIPSRKSELIKYINNLKTEKAFREIFRKSFSICMEKQTFSEGKFNKKKKDPKKFSSDLSQL
jgi:signal recognition particle GTPase